MDFGRWSELRCQYCGSETPLPFKCPFCGRYFCAEHRLPEFHGCQDIGRRAADFESRYTRVGRLKGYNQGFSRKLLPHFSSTEAIHLALGALAVFLVGLSTSISERFHTNMSLLLCLTAIFAFAFLLHEIGHKIVAEHYGLWAEFRLSLIGMILTLISIFSPVVKIISPGAVIIFGMASREMIGKISLSGPLINILLSIIFLILNLTVNNLLTLKTIFTWGLAINAFLALFNLIPLSILDGRKIFWWNRYVWASAFIISLALIMVALIIF